MPSVNIEVAADISKARNGLKLLQNDVKSLKSQSSGGISGTISSLAGNAGQSLAGNVPGFSMLQKIPALKGGLVGVGAALGAIVATGKLVKSTLDSITEKAGESASQFEKVSVKLSTISKNFGGEGANGFTAALMDAAANGVTPLEQLTDAAGQLMVAFKGNQVEALKWTKILDDVSAGTGKSASTLADMIAKFAAKGGLVDSKSINQFANYGLPIYEKLAEALGVSVEKTRELAKQGNITAETFLRAAEAAAKIHEGASGALSSLTTQGAKDTMLANKQLAYQQAGLGKNAVLKDYYDTKAAEYNARYLDFNNQAAMQGVGELAGTIDVGLAKAGDLFSDAVDKFGTIIDGINPLSASTSERIDNILNNMDNQLKPLNGLSSEELANAKGGQAFLSGKIQDLLFNKKQLEYNINNGTLEGEQLARANSLLNGTIEALEQLNPALKIAAERENEKARIEKEAEERSANLTAYKLKYGSNDEKAAALGYADSNAAYAEYSRLKKLRSTEGLTDAESGKLKALTDFVQGIQKAENDRKAAEQKAKEAAIAKQKEIESLDRLINPESAYGYDVRNKLNSAEKYAELTGGNADDIKSKVLSNYKDNILKDLENAGVVGAKIIDGVVNAGNFNNLLSFDCNYDSMISSLKSSASKRVDSAYSYGQGQMVIDYQKATEIAKQQDRQAEAIKVANQQLAVLKAVEKNTGKDQATILR